MNVVCCLITHKSSKIAIASVYRSPSICPNDCLAEIHDMFSQLLQVSSSVIVVGDFNFDLLSASCSQRKYVEILTDFCFVQHVSEPSCVTNQSATLVDHLLVTPNLSVLRSV